MVKITYTKPALEDLNSIFLYISHDSIFHAKRFIKNIEERILVLMRYPEIGRPLFPYRHPHVRQLLYKSYKIIYDFDGVQVLILVITHQRRLNSNIEALKDFYN
jgi:toxin ParE1/3/4